MSRPLNDRRISLVLLVAVVVAIGSGVGVFSLLRNARTSAGGPTTMVVVAAGDLADGRLLTAQDVRLSPVPKAAVPEGAFTVPDSVIGRVTRIPVLAGEPLIPARLAPVGASAGLEVRISRGKRAMAVRIEDAAAAVVQPNSRVDVLLITLGANGLPSGARVIMSNKRVLSVGGMMERTAAAPGAAIPIPASTLATLEVTPAEAARLAVAMNTGRLQFVLRGYGDTEPTTDTADDTEPASASPTQPARRGRRRTDTPPAPGTPAVMVPSPAAPDSTPRLPSARKRADSTTVQVFRGPALSKLSFPKKDSVIP